MSRINIKDFSMAEFLKWLSDNKEVVDCLNIDSAGNLAHVTFSYINKDTKTLKECKVMDVKETHLKLCEIFNIDVDRKIYELNINVRSGELPIITTKEFNI